LLVVSSCAEESATNLIPNQTDIYAVTGNKITVNSIAQNFKGVNVMDTFGIGDHSLMNAWNVKIVREFIGNLKEQPIIGSAILTSTNVWLHSLQDVVDENRANHIITILCPFGWVDNSGNQILFSGLNPSEEVFYDQYKLKMREIALNFKNQQDVWIEVWNEPYHWNNENNYNHNLWINDQLDMVANLRAVSGFDNIILVPGNEQGQSEDVILTKGNELLAVNYNILFDLHAYEKWLIGTTKNSIVERINQLNTHNFAIIFGEIGVINSSGLMDVTPFLSAINETNNCGVLAWLWEFDSNDQNALLTETGQINNNNNNNWGANYYEFLMN